MKGLIQYVAKALVDNPDQVRGLLKPVILC